MAHIYRLGEFQESYARYGRRITLYLTWGCICLSFGLSILWRNALFFIVTLLVAVLLNWLYERIDWLLLRRRCLLCTRGLLFISGPTLVHKESRPLAIRWDQVEVVDYDSDGHIKRLLFHDSLDRQQHLSLYESHELDRAIENSIVESLMPQAVERMKRGATLSFGPMTISQDGIQYQEKSFGWEQILFCEFASLSRRSSRKTLTVIGKNEHPLVTFDLAFIPNAGLLKSIINTQVRNAEWQQSIIDTQVQNSLIKKMRNSLIKKMRR